MRLLFLWVLLALLLPTFAAETEALSLPDGLFLTPMSALEKLGVSRQGDVLITLTRGKTKIILLCDTAFEPRELTVDLSNPCSYYTSPVILVGDELYFAPNVLEALGLKYTRKGNAVTITVPKAKPAQSLTCPLRVVPLSAKTRGCYPLLDGEGGWVLGGWSKGKWVSWEDILWQVPGDLRFHRYALDKPFDAFTVKKRDLPTKADIEVENEDHGGCGVRVNIGKEFSGVALAAEWNAMPRIPKVQHISQPVYRKEIERILTEHGYTKIPTFIVQQIIRVDFDGDGKDEVFLTADSIDDDDAPVQPPPGRFRIVVVRKIIDGQVRTIIPLAKMNPSAEIEEDIQQNYRIIGILDVDGDDVQELIVSEQDNIPARTVHVFKYAMEQFWEVMMGGFSD